MTFSPALLLPVFPALHGLFFLYSAEPAILLGQHPFTLLLEGSSRFHTAPQPLTLSLEDPVVLTPPTTPEAPVTPNGPINIWTRISAGWLGQPINMWSDSSQWGASSWHWGRCSSTCAAKTVSAVQATGGLPTEDGVSPETCDVSGRENGTWVVMCLSWAMCDSAPGLPSCGGPSAFFLAELI